MQWSKYISGVASGSVTEVISIHGDDSSYHYRPVASERNQHCGGERPRCPRGSDAFAIVHPNDD